MHLARETTKHFCVLIVFRFCPHLKSLSLSHQMILNVLIQTLPARALAEQLLESALFADLDPSTKAANNATLQDAQPSSAAFWRTGLLGHVTCRAGPLCIFLRAGAPLAFAAAGAAGMRAACGTSSSTSASSLVMARACQFPRH